MGRGRIVIDSDSDEKDMVNWLKDKRKTKADVVVIDSDHSASDDVKEPAPKRPRKQDKFQAERTMMQSFLMGGVNKPTAPASAPQSASTSAEKPKKQVLASAADFFFSSSIKESKPKPVPMSTSSTSKENPLQSVLPMAPMAMTPTASPKAATVPAPSKPAPEAAPKPVTQAASKTAPEPAQNPAPQATSKPAAQAVPKPAAASNGLPWQDKSVVLTGVLSGVSRDDAIDKIQKILGGRVTSAVSSKTAYLVTGALLEDGRSFQEGSKYRKALELKELGKGGPEILCEDSFFEVLKKHGGDKVLSSYSLPAKPVVSVATQPLSKPTERRTDNLPWTEKYRPQTVDELVGNVQSVQRLSGWLRDWEDVHVRGNKKPTQFRGSAVENVNAKAALISGSPGIGKSTAAGIICRQLGFEVLEFNASDVRGKLAIEEIAAGAATTRGLMAKKTCLVMDEVDGVSDRGGNAALIQLIKKARIPVICICNDRMDQKVRSLANSCLDIRFARPSRADVVRRVWTVLQIELPKCPGLTNIQEQEIAELAESVGCDVRQVLNTLQLRSQQPPSSNSTSWGKLKDSELMQTPFEATKILLTSSMAKNFTLGQRTDLAFIDYDLVPLLIQQNYVRCVEKVSHDKRAIEAVSRAAKLISYADRISNRLRGSNDWSLLPDFVLMSSVAPAFSCNNVLAFPEFPAYLGKLSTTNKNIRLAREFKTMLGQRISSRDVAKSGIVEVVYRKLMAEVKDGNIERAVALLNELEIPKDALTEHMTELRCLPSQIDEYKDVDSKVKAALTRAYNASAQKLRVPPADSTVAKRTGRGGGDDFGGEDGEDVDGEDDDEETGDNEKTVGGLIKQAKPKAAAKPKASSAKAKAKK